MRLKKTSKWTNIQDTTHTSLKMDSNKRIAFLLYLLRKFSGI